MSRRKELYIVIDIETDGPVPGLYSMLSVGAVATTNEKQVGEFYQKLLPLESAKRHPDTMKWWEGQPESWKEVNSDQRLADVVITELCTWLESFDAKLIPVAHPVSFDLSFVFWYLWRFTNRNPFAASIDTSGLFLNLDLSSYAAGKLGRSLENSHRTNLPVSLFKGAPQHTHNALDDARGYAVLLRNILAE